MIRQPARRGVGRVAGPRSEHGDNVGRVAGPRSEHGDNQAIMIRQPARRAVGRVAGPRSEHGDNQSIMIRKTKGFPGRRARERSELRSAPTIMV